MIAKVYFEWRKKNEPEVPVEVVVRDALQKAGYTVTTLQVQGEWDEDKPKYSGGKWNADRLPHEEIAR